MHNITLQECSRIAQDLQIRKVQVESVVQLLDEGNTIPFITRYRKERTGGLNEEVLRQIQLRVNFLRQLHDRKQTILKSIDAQGKLTDALQEAIQRADTTKRLEDLYLPYKPKKRSLAAAAREKGLEPLALAIWHSDAAAAGGLDELLPGMVNPDRQLNTVDDVRVGLQHIVAEMIAETAEVRATARRALWESGKIVAAKNEKLPEGQGLEYKDYFQFSETARQIPPHRILALNRGEKDGAVRVKMEWDAEHVQRGALHALAEHLPSVAGKMPVLLPTPPVEVASTEAPAAPDLAAPAGGEAAVAAVSEPVTDVAHVPVTAPTPTETAPVESPPEPGAAEATPQATTAPPLVESLKPSESPVPTQGTPLCHDVPFSSPHAAFLRIAFDDALVRLLMPSLEREVRSELTDEAETHAMGVFARNLRSLLLQPPLRGRRVLALDPGFRTGCKVAALDEYGNLLEHTVVYPFGGGPRKGPREKKAPPVATPPAETSPAETSPAETSPAETLPAETLPAETLPAAPPSADVSPPTPEPVGIVAETTVESQPTLTVTEPPVESSQVIADAAVLLDAPSASPQVTEAAAATPETAPAAETPPAPDRRAEARTKLQEFVAKHSLQVVALGNGTGCRETEELIAELIASSLPELSYVVVNEAGASVYSVSPIGREEFPNCDATTRSAASIGRRLQDPLSELVKIDPQSIGVGLYQHDMSRKDLRESLEAVIESSVNLVGVDVNTASVPLLRYVSGLNQLVARELVDYRKQHGPFGSREQLLQIPNLGAARYTQAAGFLKIPSGPNPLDGTWIHPESYGLTERLLAELGCGANVLADRARQEELHAKLAAVNPEDMAQRLGAGVPTVADIVQSLLKPGRDPREDLPPPIFKKGILKLEDLTPEMELKGTVLNVVDFGAFVDVGLKDSGLVHISQMANRYIKSPYDIVAVNDVVTVWVLNVDHERRRVSLTMIKPGSERRPPERRPAQAPRPPQQGPRPPRGPRPAQPAAGQGPPRDPSQDRRGPPRGRGPRHGPPPSREGAPSPRTGPPPERTSASTPPARPVEPPPPRKPRREPPRAKLTKEAIEGKVPLRTFGELSALFATKREEETPATPTENSSAAPPAQAEPVVNHAAEPAAATPEQSASPVPPPEAPPATAEANPGHESTSLS